MLYSFVQSKHKTSMKTFKLFVLSLTFLISFSSQAINTQPPKGVIMGQVIDFNSKQAIEFATVSLLSSIDSSLVSGTITSQDGTFQLKNIANGKYIIKIGFLGYHDLSQEIELTNQKEPLLLKQIAIEEASEMLSEVAIEAEQNYMETKIDKKVFNVDKDLTAKGGTGLDALRNVPSVEVDSEDNISLRGDGSVTILIDGRPSTMPIAQLLKQMPSSAIEKVEVVTNPSAKYDPEGMSGILNIITKKDKASGINGNLNASYGYGKYGKTNLSGGLNYRKGKFSVSTNLNYYNGAFWYGGLQDRSYLLNGTENFQNQKDEGVSNNQSNWGKIGVDYFLNKNHTLYISASKNKGVSDGERTVNYNFLDENEAVVSQSDRFTNSVGGNDSYTFNGGWQAKFKKPDHTLDLDITYSENQGNTEDAIRQEFGSNSISNTGQNTSLDNGSNLLYIRTDYVQPLNDSLKLEAGFHFTGRGIANDFYSETNTNGGTFVPSVALNNQFEHKQDVYASYLILGRQYKKLGVQAGLRLESTQIDAKLITTDESFKQDYLTLFPSAHFSYQLKKMDELQLSYSRRINRPEVQELNPFASPTDAYTIQTGNPFLKPEFIHVIELSRLKYWDKFNVNATLYHRIITNQKRRNLTLVDSISVVSFDNLAKGNLSGTEISITHTPNKKFRNTLTFNYWRNNITDPSLESNLNFVNQGWNVQLSSNITIGKGWSGQVSGRYAGKMEVIQGVIDPMYNVDIAVRKQLFKGKANLGLRASDVFNMRQFNFQSKDLTNYNFNTKRQWESQQFWVSFSYYFGKMNYNAPRKRQLKNRDGSDDFNTPDMQ